jgi:hypothetical protein
MTPSHLTDDQLAAALDGNPVDDVRRHLAECATCTTEVATLREGLAGCRDALRHTAERSETFWSEQRAAIQRRAHVAPRTGGRRARTWTMWTGLAAAASVALWLGLAIGRSPTPPPPAAADADDVLLLSVQQSLRRGVPAALEPAQFLVADIGAMQTRGTRP